MRPKTRGAAVRLAIAVGLAFPAAAAPSLSAGETADWTHQFGTRAPDDAEDVALDDAGDVYVVGQTSAALEDETSAGMVDAYVRKYDAAGELVWTRQFGSSDRDFARGVAVAGNGDIYVVGQTFGTLPGQKSAGSFDAFIRKYDPAGSELWTRQFGTRGGDGAVSVAIDGHGHPYVAGSSRVAMPGQVAAGEYDPFLRKYDADGAELWTRQFGTHDDDFAIDVAVDDAGDAVIVGQTTGTLPGQSPWGELDAFITRWDASGAHRWTRQFGSPADDRALSVVIDPAGDSHVVGSTNGQLTSQASAGVSDAFLRKYDSFGGEVWLRQYGTPAYDDAASVAVDAGGAILVAGRTAGSLSGQRSAGGYDAYIRRHDPGGAELWTRQFGTPEGDYALAVALDGAGIAHAAGGTLGVLTGQDTAGGRDGFAVRVMPPTHATATSDPGPRLGGLPRPRPL